MIEYTDHARRKMRERGAIESEVVDTILLGNYYPADPPKDGRELVFRDGYEFKGKSYPHKQLRVIYAEEGPKTTVVTVITRYGEWEE